KKYVVYFYPKASTPGCTAEACDLRDNENALKTKGYQIVGVSADSVQRQKNFAVKYELPFPLIADEDKKIINAFGVWGPKKFMGREYEGILRTTFIINEKGVIENVIEKVKTKEHAKQILEL
ncbi:MAG: thioredoxin-dependent thiol peroxidase, partial [Flavobacteriia bacterium]|nr:thioredoxin-dependent thiol peroxidase [Flavobacteriia bacterium]